MNILLVRHAKSDYDWERWPTDNVRPLSEKGRNRQHKVSKGMIEKNLNFDQCLVSPYVRAQETLEIILQYFEPKTTEIIDDLRVSGDPYKVLQIIRNKYRTNPESNLILVGHNPNISELAELLANEYFEMKTSDVVHCIMNENGSQLVKYYPRSELMTD